MPKITQRDIAESAAGLQNVAKDLRSAVDVSEGGVSQVKVSAMQNHAAYLDQVASELLTLIPDTPVKTPPP